MYAIYFLEVMRLDVVAQEQAVAGEGKRIAQSDVLVDATFVGFGNVSHTIQKIGSHAYVQ